MVVMVKDTKLDDKELLAERRAWVAEIAALTTAHEKEIPGLNAAVGTAAARVAEAKEVLKEAEAAHRATLGPRSLVSLRFNRERDLLQARLLDTAPPAIAAFVAEVAAESGDLQHSGGPLSVVARQSRLAALRAARGKAEALKLLALSPSELQAELDEIRDRAVEEDEVPS